MYVCLLRKILLITELIWFSFAVKLLKGQGKVFNYLLPREANLQWRDR